MEQNNEINNISNNSETTSSPTAVAVAEPAQPPAAAPAPKKSGLGKIVITAALACAVVAGGLFAAKAFLKPAPEKVIKAAVAATYSQQQKFEEKIYSEIPAAKPLFGGEQSDGSEGSFSLTLNSIGGIDYAQLISAMFSGLTISGESVSSQDPQAADIDLAVSHKNQHLISASIFLSPELALINVPELSQKSLSVNPQSLAEDYKNSIFYEPSSISEQQLRSLQDSLTSALDNTQGFSPESIKKMENDMAAIMKKAVINAQYSYDDQSKLYAVTIPGADVKSTVIELCRYIYADSDMAEFIKRSIGQALTVNGKYDSYSDAVDGMLSELESELPELPATVELDIDKNLIRSANIIITPAASASPDKASFENITIALNFSENAVTAQISSTITEDGQQLAIFSTARSSLENGVYSVSFIIDIFDEDISISIPFDCSLAASGDFNYKMSFAGSDNDNSINAAFIADGTAVLEDGILSCDLPLCSFDITSDDTALKIEFSASTKSGPLTAVPAVPAKHIPVFSMTEQDVDLLFEDIKAGGQALIGKLYDIFAGR